MVKAGATSAPGGSVVPSQYRTAKARVAGVSEQIEEDGSGYGLGVTGEVQIPTMARQR